MALGKRKVFTTKDGKTTLGMHLMLDAYGVPKKPLDNMRFVFRYLNTLPGMIGMRILMTPRVTESAQALKGTYSEGLSGVVMLYESHISMHTAVNRGSFSMDLYSCSDFEEEVETIVAYTKKLFPWKKHRLQVVKRGLQYPVKNIWK